MSTVEILRNFRVFDHFGDAWLESLLELSTLEEITEASTIVSRGDATTQLFLVLKGAIRLQRSGHYGQLTLAHILPGDLFGEVGYVDGKDHDADAIAETDAEVLCFDIGSLGAATDSDPALATAVSWTIWRGLSSKLRKANNRLAGFFGNEDKPLPGEIPLAQLSSTEAFRVGMDAKRALFREQQLSTLEINLLSSMSREQQYEPGETIFLENEDADALYVVLSGAVMINKFIPGAGDEALAFLGRGDYFGEMALLDRQNRSAGAKAHEEGATVLSIPRDVILGLLDINKVSSLRLLKLFCGMVAHRLRQSDEKLYGWYLLSAGQAPP
jgi:CRP-like cAMP-binding protein